MSLQVSLLISIETVGHRVTATIGLLSDDWDRSYRVVVEVDGDDEMEIASCVDMESGLPAPLAELAALETCKQSRWLWEQIDRAREQSALAWAV